MSCNNLVLRNLIPIQIIGSRGPAGADGVTVGTGSKYSAIDAGTLHQMSADDDFLYICTQAGTAGNAKWKRTPLQLI